MSIDSGANWIPESRSGPSKRAAPPHPDTQRFPAPTSTPAALPTSHPRLPLPPHLSPDLVSLFERISGKVGARGLGSAPNLLCDLGQISGPLQASVSSSLKWDWGCLCRGLLRGWAKLQK